MGAVRVIDSSSELTGTAVTLLRKSSGVIVSPRLATVIAATVRVLSRLTSVAMAREGSRHLDRVPAPVLSWRCATEETYQRRMLRPGAAP